MRKKTLSLSQGDILRILVFQDHRGQDEIAKALGLESRNSIPVLYKMSRLTKNMIERACDAFNVEPDVFEAGEMLNRLEESLAEMRSCREMQALLFNQIEALRQKDDALQKEIAALRNENHLLRTSQN